MNAISVSNLTKVYSDGTKALKSVNLEVEKGDFFALLGANGAGKTTFIGILTSLVNKTAGKAKVFDYDLDTEPERAKRMIGVVPQEFNFNIFEKVQDILVTQAGYFGMERKKALTESKDLLKRLGLWSKRETISRTLSGGMKRRLMIARALIHKPKLLILDEPTAGVDVELRHGMWDYLRDLNEQGVTILMTTHYLEEVEQMCRHAAIIKSGVIVKNDRVSNLVRLMDDETYSITLKEKKTLDHIEGFQTAVIDEQTLEVGIGKGQSINDFVKKLDQKGAIVTDIRPQGHRLEKLFLNLLKEESHE